MNYRYASSLNKETEARALGRDLPISTKHSVEICNMLRGKSLDTAKKTLGEVIVLKKAVPFKRFNKDVGHKKGKIAAGRYPVKASTNILEILKLAEANAQNKGITGELRIRHLVAHQAARPMRYGRRRGIEARRTHIEVIVSEMKEAETKKQEKKTDKKPKEEIKKEEPKEEKKDDTPKVADLQKEKEKAEAKKAAEEKEKKPEVKND